MEWYHSITVSMSSTTSPISSGPTKAGTYNSSTARQTKRRFLYLPFICTWQVDEMEIQFCLAQFVISNTGVMRCSLASNLNGCVRGNDYSDETGEQQQRKQRGSDGECSVEKKSTQKVLKERRMTRSAKSMLRSADGDWRAPYLG
jgi:hypothetical protein